jgi:D-alanine-D-alanine ligase
MRQVLPNVSVYGKVALLMGGWSAERDVSLNSGQAVFAALQSAGVDVTAIDADRSLASALDGFDRVFNIMHGRGGEDGVLQGALELVGMPYTGSGVLASALAMDKLRTKLLWAGMGLPTPKYVVVQSASDCQRVLDELTLPVMIKPALEGSSIGMSKVNKAEDLLAAYQLAAQYGVVFAEQWITGTEYTAAILNGEALPLIKLETDQDFYDYAAKYERNDTRYLCPCGLDEQAEAELQAVSLQAFAAVEASGWGRVDLMVDESGQPWLIEVNTVPGMTDHSLVPMAAKQAGMSFETLVQHILLSSFGAAEEQVHV